MTSPPRTSLVDRLNLVFLKQLVKTPRGRAHLLTQVAQAEETGEGAVFERLAELTSEPEIRTMIAKHAADERRHAALLHARVAAMGQPRPMLPQVLNVLHQLDARLKVFSKPLTSRTDVMRAYVFLQVLEERVVWQFALFVEALRPVDPVSAQLFENLLADEQRHVRYCQAITKRYAPSEAVRERTLLEFRAAESAAFAQNGNDSLFYILKHHLLDEGSGVQLGWWVLGQLGRVTLERPREIPSRDPRFVATDTPEPHRVRRQRLLAQHPEIRAFFGYDRRTIAVTVGVAVIHLTLAWGLALVDASWWVVLLTALGLGAMLSHWLGQTIHETSHRLAAKTVAANRALAWFANGLMTLPMAETFHRHHLNHHLHLGVSGRDTDLPLPIEIDLIGTARVGKFIWLFFYPLVYLARGAWYVRRLSFPEVVNALAIAGINLALWKWLGPSALSYLALSTYFGHGLHPVAAHFIHEHYLFAGTQETTSYTGPLNWVTFNVGYHVEHHDFMNIPGWKLPAFRAQFAGAYESFVTHDSWSKVLLEFIWRRDLGPASRLVRTEARASRLQIQNEILRLTSAGPSPSPPSRNQPRRSSMSACSRSASVLLNARPRFARVKPSF
jgi:sphingolipid 4-desaturase/C4-monooxygenase